MGTVVVRPALAADVGSCTPSSRVALARLGLGAERTPLVLHALRRPLVARAQATASQPVGMPSNRCGHGALYWARNGRETTTEG
jgi:hypothetical protein